MHTNDITTASFWYSAKLKKAYYWVDEWIDVFEVLRIAQNNKKSKDLLDLFLSILSRGLFSFEGVIAKIGSSVSLTMLKI